MRYENRIDQDRREDKMKKSTIEKERIQVGGISQGMEKGEIRPTLQVLRIPATKQVGEVKKEGKEKKRMRVAAYCRVSTGDESQQTSYSSQKIFYTHLIYSKPEWQFAGIYADEAISGTSRIHRKEFNRMMEDAMGGKIDYIITKSISRFARNTVDTLNCVRQLKQHTPPVGIFFEKENLNTLDAAGELLLTILSALAQEESRTISENIRWSFQKKFEEGKPQINLKRMIGYDKGELGEWIINEKQAEIVRFFFERYLYGSSANAIARKANEMGMRTVNGKMWTAGTVLEVLRNEKYVGDLEMQKTVTKDFLTHRSVKNKGEAPKYYVKNHHPAIVERDMWERVQLMLEGSYGGNNGRENEEGEDAEKQDGIENQEKMRKRGAIASPFCNLSYITGETKEEQKVFRMTYSGLAARYQDERSEGFDPLTENEKYIFAYPVWRCKAQSLGKKGERKSTAVTIAECALEQSFMELLYRLKQEYKEKREKCYLSVAFEENYSRAERWLNSNEGSAWKREMLERKIHELEEEAERIQNDRKWQKLNQDTMYIENMRHCLEEYRKERMLLDREQRKTVWMKTEYMAFLQYLEKLPEQNEAGWKLNIHTMEKKTGEQSVETYEMMEGLDETDSKRKELMTAPDYLHFERGIYSAFIQSGKIQGDTVEYLTTFGVKLYSTGNSRTLKDFLGFRRCGEDGEMEILDETWKVNGKNIQYRRKKKQQKQRKEFEI